MAEWVGRAAAERARIVLFPELATTGYFTAAVLDLAGPRGLREVANTRLRAAEDVVAAACKAHGVYALFGSPVFFADVNASGSEYCSGGQTGAAPSDRCARPWFNTALLVGPDGRKTFRQAKLYPSADVDGVEGDWLGTFNITNFDGGTVPAATQICFDDYHPEIFRLQAMKGAQVVFYMSWESDVSREYKLGLDGMGSQQGVVPMQAATNQLYVVQANAGALVDTMRSDTQPGAGGGSHGQSRIVDPSGRVREQARVFGEQLLIHDIDLNQTHLQSHRWAMAGLRSKMFGRMWAAGLAKMDGPPMPIEW
jgi:predicted amidohydrolase